MPTKVCNMCKEEKPLNMFHKASRSSDGHQYSCKHCKKAYQSNSKSRLEVSRKYYARNTHKHSQLVRARQAGLKKATPDWLTEAHKLEMSDLYWLARDLSTFGDEPYEVDHIVPLKGRDICGLHVPWNLQVLPRSINRSKHNGY